MKTNRKIILMTHRDGSLSSYSSVPVLVKVHTRWAPYAKSTGEELSRGKIVARFGESLRKIPIHTSVTSKE